MRRGVADLDGTGEVVSGIVVMRQGENALAVIDRVKAKLKEIEPGLPPGVKLVTAYDRSELILALHRQPEAHAHRRADRGGARDPDLPVAHSQRHHSDLTIPIAVLISFVPMRLMGMSSNIMSLGGIAIAVGAMVDAAIVVVEQTHKKLEGAHPSWTAEITSAPLSTR
jgi:Cu(I)/Ag(I) efflux system membrane protein CusA/SilA